MRRTRRHTAERARAVWKPVPRRRFPNRTSSTPASASLISRSNSMDRSRRLCVTALVNGSSVATSARMCVPGTKRRPSKTTRPSDRGLISIRADLIGLLELDDAAFEQRFGESALSRPGPRGVLRNAAIVLGNRGRRTGRPRAVSYPCAMPSRSSAAPRRGRWARSAASLRWRR